MDGLAGQIVVKWRRRRVGRAANRENSSNCKANNNIPQRKLIESNQLERKLEKRRGFGFVTFADPNSVEKVLANGPHELDGKKVDPKIAFPKRSNQKVSAPG